MTMAGLQTTERGEGGWGELGVGHSRLLHSWPSGYYCSFLKLWRREGPPLNMILRWIIVFNENVSIFRLCRTVVKSLINVRYGDEILPDGWEFTNTCRHSVATAPIPCHLKIPQHDSYDHHINIIKAANIVQFVWVQVLCSWILSSVIIVNPVYVRNFSRKRRYST